MADLNLQSLGGVAFPRFNLVFRLLLWMQEFHLVLLFHPLHSSVNHTGNLSDAI